MSLIVYYSATKYPVYYKTNEKNKVESQRIWQPECICQYMLEDLR